MGSKLDQLYILSNSPGEISAWVRPVVEYCHAQNPETVIDVFLTPCQYATGGEADVIKRWPGIRHVYKPRETFRFLGRPQRAKKKGAAILYLGGDPNYARWLSLKLKLPLLGYNEHKTDMGWRFRQTFLNRRDGDLMACSLKLTDKQAIDQFNAYDLPKDNYLLVMCGSRPKFFFNLIPLMAPVIKALQEQNPGLKIVLLKSPFIESNRQNTFLEKFDFGNCTIAEGPSLPFIQHAKLLLSVPGTNTAEAMYVQTPMFIIVPLNHPQHLILDGLAGLIGYIPIVGTIAKHIIVWVLKRKIAYFSKPNIIAQKPLVKDWVGHIKTQDLATQIATQYYDEKGLTRMKNGLARFKIDRSILDKIYQGILGTL